MRVPKAVLGSHALCCTACAAVARVKQTRNQMHHDEAQLHTNVH